MDHGKAAAEGGVFNYKQRMNVGEYVHAGGASPSNPTWALYTWAGSAGVVQRWTRALRPSIGNEQHTPSSPLGLELVQFLVVDLKTA